MSNFFGAFFLLLFLESITVNGADFQVTVYPTFLAQHGRTHFETDRWDGHNGLDPSQYISKAKAIGTESGRWLNRDLNGRVFQDVSVYYVFIIEREKGYKCHHLLHLFK